jgi:two-component system, LuxR family, response regulator DctR
MTAQLVYVVDDDEAVRDALAMLFRSAGLAVQSFPSAACFLEACRPAERSCLVLDIRMPGMSGGALQDALRERGWTIPIIFVTGHGDIPMAVAAVKKGAFDFIAKPFDDEHLLASVRGALDDCAQRSRAADLTLLSMREREVLELVLAGKPSWQIGEELFISTKTVDFHRARILQKLQVRSTAQLFRLCLGSQM